MLTDYTASCTPNPALCSSFETDFTKGSMDGWKATAGSLNYVSDGAEFTISKRGEAPTIQTNAYLFFGYVEVVMKSAVGTGIISSIVLESDDLDEVDWVCVLLQLTKKWRLTCSLGIPWR
jgi:hypothetical protein